VNKALHLLSFKIGWALCLWAAITQWPLFSWLIGLGLLTVNISLQKRRRISICKVLTVLLLGPVFELVNLHLFLYQFPLNPAWHPPMWLLAFWPVFALMFIEWIDAIAHKPLWWHFLLGVSGGLGYYGGEWAQLIAFNEPKVLTVSIFCALWAVEYILIMKATVWVGKLSFLQD